MRDPTAQRLLQHWVDLVGDLLLRPHPTMPIERLLAELYLTFGTGTSWTWRDADETFGFLLHRPVPEWPVVRNQWIRGCRSSASSAQSCS